MELPQLKTASFMSPTLTVTTPSTGWPPSPGLVKSMDLLLKRILLNLQSTERYQKNDIQHRGIQVQSVDRIRGSTKLDTIINTSIVSLISNGNLSLPLMTSAVNKQQEYNHHQRPLLREATSFSYHITIVAYILIYNFYKLYMLV